jgi:hypothetical protein
MGHVVGFHAGSCAVISRRRPHCDIPLLLAASYPQGFFEVSSHSVHIHKGLREQYGLCHKFRHLVYIRE